LYKCRALKKTGERGRQHAKEDIGETTRVEESERRVLRINAITRQHVIRGVWGFVWFQTEVYVEVREGEMQRLRLFGFSRLSTRIVG